MPPPRLTRVSDRKGLNPTHVFITAVALVLVVAGYARLTASSPPRLSQGKLTQHKFDVGSGSPIDDLFVGPAFVGPARATSLGMAPGVSPAVVR